jgi:hypothetical protein
MLGLMELSAIPSVAPGVGGARSVPSDAHAVTADVASRERASRASVVPRSRARPGTGLGHDVLLALIMAVAMAATVFLYR